MKRRGLTPEEDEANGWIERGIITKVDAYEDGHGWSISYGESWGCGFRNVGVEPKVGDELTTYGQWGYSFHGQALNGKVIWYLTVEEEQAEHEAMVARNKAERLAAFEKNREQMDRDYDALPPLFKVRIDRFRKANPEFRVEHEGYEMFVCSQAVVLAEWAAAQDGDPGEAIDAWDKINSKDNDPPYDYKAQLAAVPGWEEGHSGNTHGCAVALAKQYLTHRERVPLMNGAMAPLVGTADYSERTDA
jgi:hypothetical protein